MFEKVKGKFAEIKEENQRKREERERIARERTEEVARLERKRIQAEKDVLMALTEKELMVEAIMALRGYNTRLTLLEEHNDDLDGRVDSLESQLSSLDSSVSEIKEKSDY